MIQYAEDEKETGNMNRLYDNYSENVDYDKTWGLIEYCIALVLNEKDFQNFKVHFFFNFILFSHCTARGSGYPYMYTLQLQFFPHHFFCCNMSI